jgi:amidohydrolase
MAGAQDMMAQVEALRDQLVAWRRDFHRHPELSLQEHRSAGIIATRLSQFGYEVQTGIAGTGVVATLAGPRPGPVVMCRFDMDALPVSEETGASYASENTGVMHACGHDAHMALGLGVATLMAGRWGEMAGTLKLLFQPAEEALDGARRMVEAGVLANPTPDVFLAAHVMTEIPVGIVDVSAGPIMAASDAWDCTIEGRGGHGALPHQTVDPIAAAALVVTALQTVVSRNVNPLDTAVVTVGTIHGGEVRNIIPTRVSLTGTIRTYSLEARERVLGRVREIIEGVAAACGARATLEIVPGTPAVENDPEVAEAVRAAAEAVVGPESVTSGYRTMGSEDAAFFLQAVPGCYFFFGGANPERGLDAAHHSPHFDLDEDVLPLGVAVFLRALEHYLL